MNIIFFEDQFTRDTNLNLHLDLQHYFGGSAPQSRIHWPVSVKDFETLSSTLNIEIFILDIMTRPEELTEIHTGDAVSDSMTGIELLKRIRSNYYKKNSNSLVYIRSARVAEFEIKEICMSLGATECFRAGWDDEQIIQHIEIYLKNAK